MAVFRMADSQMHGCILLAVPSRPQIRMNFPPMNFLHILFPFALVAGLWAVPAIRDWFKTLTVPNRRIVICVLTLIVAGHCFNQCRQTFPFVRWAMYTRQYESEEFNCIELHAIDASGQRNSFSPIKYYPSVARNFYPFFLSVNKLAKQHKLTPSGELVYEQLLHALVKRYNEDHVENPAVCLQAVLVTAQLSDGKRINENVVKQIELGGRDDSNSIAIAHTNLPFAIPSKACPDK